MAFKARNTSTPTVAVSRSHVIMIGVSTYMYLLVLAMMRWCINGELMVLVVVVPKHAQCPAVLLSELPPKSFHGWTVRTLLHKKATSVPGSQVLLIGSEALIQYQSPSTIQINCVKIRTVTFMWTLEGQVGVEGVTYLLSIV